MATREDAERIAAALRGREPTEVEVIMREAAIKISQLRGEICDLRDIHNTESSALAYPHMTRDGLMGHNWKIESGGLVIQMGIRRHDGTDEAVS